VNATMVNLFFSVLMCQSQHSQDERHLYGRPRLKFKTKLEM
jgi:hypothetical protein